MVWPRIRKEKSVETVLRDTNKYTKLVNRQIIHPINQQPLSSYFEQREASLLRLLQYDMQHSGLMVARQHPLHFRAERSNCAHTGYRGRSLSFLPCPCSLQQSLGPSLRLSLSFHSFLHHKEVNSATV